MVTVFVFKFQFSRYCAVLLNDERHSYPEVISALKRSLKCPQKLATDLTEYIDKEGRAVVKVGSYQVSQDRMEITHLRIHLGSEIRMCLDFEWSKRVRLATGLDFN